MQCNTSVLPCYNIIEHVLTHEHSLSLSLSLTHTNTHTHTHTHTHTQTSDRLQALDLEESLPGVEKWQQELYTLSNHPAPGLNSLQ